ncbi:MAG: nitroreductase [Deltaproteobacteria bacterium]|nr:nitroreductase [Deltaproteobacteria bacterium]
MNDVTRTIRERRSIRRYRQDPIPEADLTMLLEAVRWSPSWANTQCWDVVVVCEEALKRRLQAAVGSNPAFDAMVDAPVVLVLCGRKDRAGFKKGEAATRYGDWMMYDLGLANQSLCLAAHALGLGTVIVGKFDHAAAERILGVPETHAVVTMVPVGYPAQPAAAPPRKALREFVHEGAFGTPWGMQTGPQG